jgi:hypothetical protein
MRYGNVSSRNYKFFLRNFFALFQTISAPERSLSEACAIFPTKQAVFAKRMLFRRCVCRARKFAIGVQFSVFGVRFRIAIGVRWSVSAKRDMNDD